MRVFLVSPLSLRVERSHLLPLPLWVWVLTDRRFAEEFSIYLNYVRKLGFEETPDYDFLRELFTKVLKNSGEVEDGQYDWMLLNNGKGWEASSVSDDMLPRVEFHLIQFIVLLPIYFLLPQLLNAANASAYDRHRSAGVPREQRERERAARHAQRESQLRESTANASNAAIVPPSPALVRHGSKQGRKSGVPGGLPSSPVVAAHTIPPGTGAASRRQNSHPYATGERESDYGQGGNGGGGYNSAQATNMSIGGATPVMNQGGRQGTGAGVAGRGGAVGNGDYMDHDERQPPKGIGQKLVEFITCRCT